MHTQSVDNRPFLFGGPGNETRREHDLYGHELCKLPLILVTSVHGRLLIHTKPHNFTATQLNHKITL